MLVIKNGQVHDGLGNVRHQDIAVENGRIVCIGPELSAEGARIIDAEGCEVFPGFIDALNIWGTQGPGWTESDNHEGSDPVTPEMNIIYGFDHDGMNFQRVYDYGVTAAGIAPSSKNLMSGQAAVFKTIGKSPYRMLVRESAALVASVTNNVKKAYKKREVAPMTRMGIFAMMKTAFEKARRHDPEKHDYDPKSQTLRKVLSGELPLFVGCSGKSQIDAVLSLLKEYPQIDAVLTGAYGLDTSHGPVASGKIAVVLGDQTEDYYPDARKTEHREIVKLLESADGQARIAIGCCGDGMTSGKESLLWNAIHWRRHGASAETVLKAITSAPAQILGVADRIGSIEIGKDADLSIWSANPLNTYEARVRHVLIDGEEVLNKEVHSCW